MHWHGAAGRLLVVTTSVSPLKSLEDAGGNVKWFRLRFQRSVAILFFSSDFDSFLKVPSPRKGEISGLGEEK